MTTAYFYSAAHAQQNKIANQELKTYGLTKEYNTVQAALNDKGQVIAYTIAEETNNPAAMLQNLKKEYNDYEMVGTTDDYRPLVRMEGVSKAGRDFAAFRKIPATPQAILGMAVNLPKVH